ncbi:MAG: DNA topoisomerase [Clostridia bacterium]|nr:DNA topoisomerase [Clostridia bacterium]MBO5315240.1 DNA topoisomerase [Clostridia bacterium]MBR3806273.1 DNA topoisomerase [Clostridia bacterium]
MEDWQLATKLGKKEYDDQSIKSLKGADRVRKRPAVIFGSDDLIGCQHSFIEILANSVDEAREGYGDKIIVKKYNDLSIEVEDFGRGVPLGYNEKEKRWNWELVFCELYAGGKYDNNDGNSAYEFSLGLNGLGATATQYSSEFMTVDSYNGKTLSSMKFKSGNPVGDLSVVDIASGMKKRGTIIRWRPDLKVFKEIDIPVEFLSATLRRQAFVNAGIRFILEVEQENGKFEKSEYYYENGVADYIAEITEGIATTSPVIWKLETKGRDREDMPDYKLKAEVTFCFAKSGTAEYYHNSSFLEYGGAPDKAVKNAFTYAIDKYIKGANKYTKNESKISFADIADNLAVIVNSASTQTSYENQTKKAITNAFIQKALTEFIKTNLEIYLTENASAANTIANQVLVNKRARESAEKTKIDIKKKLTGTMDVSNRVEKFVPCRSKDPDIREVYIVEGDSAMSSCKLGRNADFQAIIPVRGKTLNCMKSSYEKIFASDIIVDLLKVIGCGVEVKTGKKGDLATFDYNLLKWNKIIICTDADEDGFQIRTLLLTMFYRLLPTLIEKGKIYIAESPLFEITSGGETYFAYNEQEKTEILSKLGSKKYTLQRSKGLGENEPDMMWRTTMCPQTRRLVAVTPADAEATARMFDVLLGDALQDRKKFITDYGHLYIKDADI